MVYLNNLNKHIAVFGAGRTGIDIACELVSLGMFVDVFDINLSPELRNTSNIRFTQLPNNIQGARNTLKHELYRNNISNYDSIFHTFLYTARDLEKFIQITQGLSAHFGTIGTILTYDRQIDRGVLDEKKPKISLEDININGGYSAGKRELEEAITTFKKNNPNIRFFVCETFHILGEKWIPGITPPHFRDQNLLDTLESGHLSLPFAGDILYQIVDGKDLAKYITLGIQKKLDGNFIILNQKIISAKEYYEKLAFLIHKKIKIHELDISQICDTKMMLLDWVCCTKTLENALGTELVFIDHDITFNESIFTLEKTQNKTRGDPKRSDIWYKMNNGEPPDIIKMELKINKSRKLKLF